MSTERVDPRFAELDAWPLASALEAMWESQLAAAAAVRQALSDVTVATEAAADALGETGRIVYVGAGTSGRVAIQDGAELPPTFNWPLDRLVFAIAGGSDAMVASREGAEDSAEDGIQQMEAASLTAADVVIGVAASGTTPYTVAAIQKATEMGAVTIGIANNPDVPLLQAARFPVYLPTGSEFIAGSTRMKAGTAQKIVLNMISSGMMIRLGRVYGGMMVNMQLANAKLERRGAEIVSRIADCDTSVAAEALKSADGEIKVATLMALGSDKDQARALLDEAGGNLRRALAERM